ncbi:DUF3533 domain-containing protein [Mesobacillus zeae]|uniref:DUF3533 domain-containing protein n=1 Tax=Mesobacillus zeae TaxID=1917180 RepID=A0A398AVA6_9BACI|nr:DUF3533 domain-containing protein [Mesobacillus zeae]
MGKSRKGVVLLETLQLYLKRPETLIGLGAALIFQLVFIIVWLTAYNGVTDRTGNLHIGLVNEDKQQGATLSEEMKKRITAVNITSGESLEESQKDMDNNKIDMIIHIPKDFSQNLMSNKQTEITYYINQSTSMLTARAMETIAKDIGDQINSQVFLTKRDAISASLQQVIPPQNAQPTSPVSEIIPRISEAVKQINNHPVKNTIVQSNSVNNFSFTMVPLMIVLASFVGAMVMSMQLQQASRYVIKCKWKSFAVRQSINVVWSLLLSLITVSFLLLFQVELQSSFTETWLFQSFTFFSFLCFSQLFVVVFGNPGMLFNIIALSLQLVTCGAIVPVNMLPDFFQAIGVYLPATYVANGYHTIIYGAGDLMPEVSWLLAIAGTTLLLSVFQVFFLKNKDRNTSQAEVA